MKKITLTCAALLLIALAFNNTVIQGLMGWLNTPMSTKAEIAGKDGELTVTTAGTIVNKYAVLAVDAVAGSSMIAITNPGGANGLDPSMLSPGDLIMLIQMAGASIDGSDSANYGTVTNLNNAGRHEFVTVNKVDGNMITINPPCGGLKFNYTVTGKVQVIRVPQYSKVTVNAGASLTSPAWDGKTGGIVVVHVQDTAIVNGTIDVSALGFRGGALSAAGGGGFRNDYRTTQQDFGAQKGEGIAGYQMELDFSGGQYGRGAAANGGGGGTSHNSGGGGGGNGNNGKVWTGQGVMDGSVTGAAAWQLDPGYISNGNALTDSAGGGRGGYSYAVNNGNALTQGPGDAIWGGDNRRAVGGLGGRPVPQDTTGRIFVGGGGGAGAQNNDSGGAGGNGGGLIYIIAKNVSGSGTLRANGGNGGNTRNEHRDGAGGGGGGGTIVVAATTLSGVSAQANGGNGGNQSQPTAPAVPDESEGPGGGGSGGFVAFSGGSMTISIVGGIHGITGASAIAEFPPNGATRGASGTTSSVIANIPFCSTTTDLSITKTNNANAVVPGAQVTYVITAENKGPNDVFGVPVTDTAPAIFSNITWTCSATPGSKCFAINGVGNIDTKVDLLKDGKAIFMLTATPDPAATGTVANTAKIGMPDGAVDTDPTNDESTDTDPLTPQADLSITKTNGVNTLTAGIGTTYTIVVANNGPSLSNGATVTDVLPSKLTNGAWTCVGSAGATCNAANGTGNINATVNLPPNSFVTFTVTATVASGATGTVVNTATVAPPLRVPDPITANNTATDTDVIAILADLSITKTNNSTQVTPGTQTTYSIVVSNAGPSAVSQAQVVDNLPSNLTNASWTCTASAGSSCIDPIGTGGINAAVDLSSGGSATFTLIATVISTASGSVTNTAAVSTPQGTTDPTPGNNSATDTDPITIAADLAITKTNNVTSVTAGVNTTYQIAVRNNGPSAVVDAKVTDAIPSQLTNASWTCAATGGSSCGAAAGSGNIDAAVSLLPNGVATFTLTAQVMSNATGTVANIAVVAPPSGVNDPTPGNNSATDTDPIGRSADLAITKTANAPVVTPGNQVTYTIEVVNNGPSNVTGATVADAVPGTLTGPTWTCTATAGSTCGTAGGNGNISATVDLLVGGKATFILIATVSGGANGEINNTAQVTAPPGTNDPGGNNTSTATINVSPRSDLKIVKTPSANPVRAGDPLTYTLSVTNQGPSIASSVVVTDILPSGLSFTSATASQGSCTGNGTITCNLGTLGATAPNNVATVTIKVQIPFNYPVGQLANTGSVTSSVTDPNPGDNSSTSTITVKEPPGGYFRPADVSIKIIPLEICIGPGKTVEAEIDLRNSGDGIQLDNPGAEFSAQLPARLAPLNASCTSSTGQCTLTNSRIDWNGSLPPGETVKINFRFRIGTGTDVNSRFCIEYRLAFDTNSDGINEGSSLFNNCFDTTCTPPPCSGPDCPNNDPGTEIPVGPNSIASDDKPGSILIFPFYSSDASSTNRENTRFSITNTHAFLPAFLHLFYIDGSECTVADNFICITPNQTTSFLASDIDPGISGYMIVVPVDADGSPISFNHLIGDSYIKMSSGHIANLAAVSVTAIQPPKFTPNDTAAVVKFDGIEFSQLGRTIAADNIMSLSEGNNTVLIVNRIGGDLTLSGRSVGLLAGLMFDDEEKSYSFSLNEGSCQLRKSLNNSYPRLAPRFSDVIPTGHTGWMKLSLPEEGALVGATISFNPNPEAYRGGHNMHILRLGNASITLPLIPPPCR